MTRKEFEQIVSGPPYERSIQRYGLSTNHAWPGQYEDIAVQFAWEVLRKAQGEMKGEDKE